MSDQPPGSPGEPSGEDESVLGQLWDIVRYAPIAIVLDGPGLLPKLAEQGKVHMANARVLGPRALRQLEPRARQLAEDIGATAGELLKRLGAVPEPSTDADTDAPAPAPRRRSPSAARPVPIKTTTSPNGDGDTEPVDAGPAVDELAIPDYDSLPAAHVLNRLPGLSADELEAVRRYEAGHRSRKTILNKVAQLQQAS